MRWDALFADMEAQLDAAAAADRVAEVADRTRAERATVELVDRLRSGLGRPVVVALRNGRSVEGSLVDVAAAWLLVADGVRQHLVPASAVDAVEGADVVAAPRAGESVRRLGLGHALRALARDRRLVQVETSGGVLLGRVDTVGADHLDVGVADPATSRPTGRRRTVPFTALVRVGEV
ncbi:hypothetical protein Q9R32_03870 [Actinotalea sp. AC32]|nr:hypothetical protein [Actinotalea sp. AC32]